MAFIENYQHTGMSPDLQKSGIVAHAEIFSIRKHKNLIQNAFLIVI